MNIVKSKCGLEFTTLDVNGFSSGTVPVKLVIHKSLVLYGNVNPGTYDQWVFQNPKIEVLYHVRPYFGGISPDIALKDEPYIG